MKVDTEAFENFSLFHAVQKLYRQGMVEEALFRAVMNPPQRS